MEPTPQPRQAYRRFVPPLAIARSSSFLFVIGAAVAFALLPGGATAGARERETPVEGSRRILHPADSGREILLVDGNRANEVAMFPHDEHIRRLGPDGCATCHHMNKPHDRQTSCYECHRDQYVRTDIFDHRRHVAAHGGNSGCSECHGDPSLPKTRANTKPCLECHQDLIAGGDLVPPPASDSPFHAASYLDAMHGTCLKCHDATDEGNREKLPRLGLCGTCHPAPEPFRSHSAWEK